MSLSFVSLSLVMKTAIIGGGAKVHLIGAWEMMLWVGPCAKSLSHYSHGGLKGENFLDGLLNQHLPCIMVGWTQWSMLAISTGEWLSTQGMKP